MFARIKMSLSRKTVLFTDDAEVVGKTGTEPGCVAPRISLSICKKQLTLGKQIRQPFRLGRSLWSVLYYQYSIIFLMYGHLQIRKFFVSVACVSENQTLSMFNAKSEELRHMRK